MRVFSPVFIRKIIEWKTACGARKKVINIRVPGVTSRIKKFTGTYCARI